MLCSGWAASVTLDFRFVCPAYEQVCRGKNARIHERREQLVRLILNGEKLQKAEHPMERIVAIIEAPCSPDKSGQGIFDCKEGYHF
jgi:hypothetical protein